MKKIFYLFIFLCTLHLTSFAQDEQEGGQVRERMMEYLNEKLGLSKDEAGKFTPVFIEYFKELKKTNQEFRGDKLVLQQKIAELRLRFRDQFKPIIGEKRSNDVFTHYHDFIQKVKQEKELRMKNRQ